MSFSGANIPIRTRVDTTELKAAISEFDGSTEALKRLKDATKDVKDESKDLVGAISTLNRANRANNFEMLEAMRTIRSFTSLARDLNQVWQSITLRNIEGTQQTVAQRQAFQDLKGDLDNLGNALSIFGPNGEVKQGFSDFVSAADDLSSVQLQGLIDQAESLKTTLKLTPEQMTALDDFIQKLKDLKKETISDEDKKKWEDYFGVFTNASLAAGGVAQVAAQLGNHKEALATLIRFVAANQPEIAIIVLLLFGKDAAEALGLLQYAGDSETDTVKPGTINPQTGKPYDFTPGPNGIVPDQGTYPSLGEIKINMYDTVIRSDEDTAKLAINVADRIERIRSLYNK